MQKFLNIHPGAHAILVGSGPSLSSAAANFETLSADAIVCAVNEVALDLPRVDYAFANDANAADWVERLPEHVYFFHPRRTALSAPAAHCQITSYQDAGDGCLLTADRARLAAKGLFADEGTINSALQILHIMGVERITCVGLDGDRPPYDRIRRAFEAHAARLGITLEFAA
jgi:hypothetical protein